MELRDEKNIYTYYKNFRRDLIDSVYSVAASFPALKTIFTKKWGNYLKGNGKTYLTEEEKEVFETCAITFEKYLLIANELQQKHCTLQQIHNFLAYKLGLQTGIKRNSNVKTYLNVEQILKNYQLTLSELNSILNTLPKVQKYCFISYYKKKLEIYEIAEQLKWGYNAVIGCLNTINTVLEVYQTGKLLENIEIPKIESQLIEILEQTKSKEENKPVLSAPKVESPKVEMERKIPIPQKNIIKIFQDKKEIQETYGLSEEQLNKILEELSKDSQIAFIYVNGIDRPKLSIEQIANILKCDEKAVYVYLNNAYTKMDEYKTEITLECGTVNQRKIIGRMKTSLYDGYEEKDRKYVTEVIEYWKITNLKYYNFVIKLYGESYDKLDIEVYRQLTEEEKKKLHSIHTNLRARVETRKNQSKLGAVKKGKMIISLYDGYAEEDKKYVTEVTEYWKITNLKYYNLVIKLYGKSYDKLDIKVYRQLTEEEKKMLRHIHTHLREMVEIRKNQSKLGTVKKGKIKISLYEGYAEEDRKYVAEATEYWKITNKKRYNLVIKLYGKSYDKLNIEAYQQLTDEEKKKLDVIHTNLKAMVETRKNQSKLGIVKKGKIKISLYEGYAEEDKKYVTEVIEYWKITNLKYYNLVIKLYGKSYDKLNIEAYRELTEEEKKKLIGIHASLGSMVETRKNQSKLGAIKKGKIKISLYEGYAEEDKKYVTEVIEYWKITNLKYYNLVIKLYGKSYDKLDIKVYRQLTEEEKKVLNGIHASLGSMVETRKNKSKLGAIKKGKMIISLYDGYAEEDKKYVTEVIEYWKITNLKYYNLVIKLYGKSYDKLNIEAYRQLTEEEKKMLGHIHSHLRARVETRKKRSRLDNDGKRRGKIKLSLYEGYEEEDKKYVTEVIEYWKLTNLTYYNLVVKLYGKSYDKLDIEVYRQLTEEEKKIWNIIRSNLGTMVKTRKNRKNTLSKDFQKIAVSNQNEKQAIEEQNIGEVFTRKTSNLEKILIKDIFPNEIIEIQKMIYIQMQKQDTKRQKEAIAAWDRLEQLIYKSLNDHDAFTRMLNLISQFQNAIPSIYPIDEETIAKRIKKL